MNSEPVIITGVIRTRNITGQRVTDAKGMYYDVQPGDTVIVLPKVESKKYGSQNICPFDLHKWFKASKQI